MKVISERTEKRIYGDNVDCSYEEKWAIIFDSQQEAEDVKEILEGLINSNS